MVWWLATDGEGRNESNRINPSIHHSIVVINPSLNESSSIIIIIAEQVNVRP